MKKIELALFLPKYTVSRFPISLDHCFSYIFSPDFHLWYEKTLMTSCVRKNICDLRRKYHSGTLALVVPCT